jgi:hypothetical protein
VSEYTPEEGEVWGAYKFWLQQWSDKTVEEITAEFDRWLAEVKAQAWEEGRYTQYREYPRPARRDNPYRQGGEQ